jgi:hypothetical protein
MRYLLLIYGDENRETTDEEQAAIFQEYGRYTQELRASGAMKSGEPLEGRGTARTLRIRDGQRAVSDGPYAETKEQLGGFYEVECDSLDDAIAWAAKIPTARTGGVEVRPVREIPGG